MKGRTFTPKGWMLVMLSGSVFATYATCTYPTEDSNGTFHLASSNDDLVDDVLDGIDEVFEDDD